MLYTNWEILKRNLNPKLVLSFTTKADTRLRMLQQAAQYAKVQRTAYEFTHNLPTVRERQLQAEISQLESMIIGGSNLLRHLQEKV